MKELRERVRKGWQGVGRGWADEVDIVRVHLSIETRCIHSKGRVEGGEREQR
jgi:hypothetical protein